MAARYAEQTEVPVERSRVEIERTLIRYGASAFAYAWTPVDARIEFAAEGRRIRFVLPLPDRNRREFTHHARGPRTPEAAEKMWEQACRQRWRALGLAVKAKLEAVEVGISTFDREFGMAVVLPDGSVVADSIVPAIDEAYERGTGPLMITADQPGV